MAPKAKKESSNSGEDCTMSWPDLPQQLIQIISWQPTLIKHVGDGGVIKSWRPPSKKQCNSISKPPIWLQLHDDGNDQDRKFNFNITSRFGDYVWRSRRPWPEPWKYYKGFADGALVAKGESPAEYYRICYSTFGEAFCCLPPWDPMVPFGRSVVSSCSEKSVMMVLTGISDPAFAFYGLRGRGGLGEYAWIKRDCNIPDPQGSNSTTTSVKQNFMRFTNAIGYQGKFFALSLQGTLAVIEAGGTDSFDLKITALGPKRAVPNVHSRHFREYLVESSGEILLVFLISRKSANVVDDVEVFQLDIGSLSWVKMERIGDRTLFLGTNCCMSIIASKMGIKSECVYFSNKSVEGWWVYDLQARSISSCSSDGILPSISRALNRTKVTRKGSGQKEASCLRVFS